MTDDHARRVGRASVSEIIEDAGACPRCDSTTQVKMTAAGKYRVCPECPWQVYLSESSDNDQPLEDRVAELEDEVEMLKTIVYNDD